MRFMPTDPSVTVWLVAFLGLSAWVATVTIRALTRGHVTCASAFRLFWLVGYAGPVALRIAWPDRATQYVTYSWMSDLDWVLASFAAVIGLALLELGYGAVWRREPPWTSHRAARSDNDPILVILSLLVVSVPITLLWINDVQINFASRHVHWRQIGIAIRLLLFGLPALIVALLHYMECPTRSARILLAVTLVTAGIAGVALGQRMLLVLTPVAIVLSVCLKRRGVSIVMLGVLTVTVSTIAIGYSAAFRSTEPLDASSGIARMTLGDVGRMHVMAYTLQHSGPTGSDLIERRLLSSYLHPLILGVPRSVWPGKPFPINRQFSYYFRYEHGDLTVPAEQADMVGQNEFGVLEETLLVFGPIGAVLALMLVGGAGKALDVRFRESAYARLVAFLACGLGMIYSFMAVFSLLLPCFCVGIIRALPLSSPGDKVVARMRRRARTRSLVGASGCEGGTARPGEGLRGVQGRAIRTAPSEVKTT